MPGLTRVCGVMLAESAAVCLEDRKHQTGVQLPINGMKYFRNFVGLAQGIAPDGRRVDLVGFTALRNGQERKVPLRTKRKSSLSPEVVSTTKSSGEPVKVSGVLRRADSLKEGKDESILVGADGVHHTVIVPPGMMSDIVKPLWEMEVLVTGVRKGKKIRLQEIRSLNADEQEPE